MIKFYAGVVMLSLVECRSGKQVDQPKTGMTTQAMKHGGMCLIAAHEMDNCDIDAGEVTSKIVECDPANAFGIRCPVGAKIIGGSSLKPQESVEKAK